MTTPEGSAASKTNGPPRRRWVWLVAAVLLLAWLWQPWPVRWAVMHSGGIFTWPPMVFLVPTWRYTQDLDDPKLVHQTLFIFWCRDGTAPSNALPALLRIARDDSVPGNERADAIGLLWFRLRGRRLQWAREAHLTRTLVDVAETGPPYARDAAIYALRSVRGAQPPLLTAEDYRRLAGLREKVPSYQRDRIDHILATEPAKP